MRLARNDVRLQWFSPGTCAIEQGVPVDELYLVVNGTADALSLICRAGRGWLFRGGKGTNPVRSG